jgi:putative addiction module component (TIGR02574 family)
LSVDSGQAGLSRDWRCELCGGSDSQDDDQLPLTAAQRAVLDRRVATLDQDRRAGITWAALKAELEQRCP